MPISATANTANASRTKKTKSADSVLRVLNQLASMQTHGNYRSQSEGVEHSETASTLRDNSHSPMERSWLMALHWVALGLRKKNVMYKGSCLCGKIHYRINSELSDFSYCHCRSCRKASGTAHGSNAGVDRRHFDLWDPEELLREYESSPGKFRTFCSNCGSPIFAYLAATKDLVRVRLGTLDTPFDKPGQSTCLCRRKGTMASH